MSSQKRFRYSTVKSDMAELPVAWMGGSFLIRFHELNVDDRIIYDPSKPLVGWRGIEVSSSTGEPPFELMNYLSVYFGEDIFPIRPHRSLENPDQRGIFEVNAKTLKGYLLCAEEWSKFNASDKWKLECMHTAIGYFCSAISMGLEHTPTTPGIFAIAIEVIANAWSFSPQSYRKYRAKHGPENMFKSALEGRLQVSALADLALLYSLRNKAGSHFSLHIEQERDALVDELRLWMIRRGCSKDLAESSFVSSRLLDDLQRSGHTLYNTALTSARLAFFICIGAQNLFSVADRDGFA